MAIRSSAVLTKGDNLKSKLIEQEIEKVDRRMEELRAKKRQLQLQLKKAEYEEIVAEVRRANISIDDLVILLSKNNKSPVQNKPEERKEDEN